MNTTVAQTKASGRHQLRASPNRGTPRIPPLVHGDKMDSDEFIRRYEAMTEIKAELIDGVVYLPQAPAHIRAENRPPLVHGESLSTEEFLRRYEAMPQIKKAELIDGIVYIMSPPLDVRLHAQPDSLMQWIAYHYAMHTPEVRSATNATTCLEGIGTFQPDALLRCLPARTGRLEKFTKEGYLATVPELVAEIASSSTKTDMGKKKDAYCRAGVFEYIVWNTRAKEFNYWHLEGNKYSVLGQDADGIIRSRIFPGLWLDPSAILSEESTRISQVLNSGLKSKEHAAFVKLVK